MIAETLDTIIVTYNAAVEIAFQARMLTILAHPTRRNPETLKSPGDLSFHAEINSSAEAEYKPACGRDAFLAAQLRFKDASTRKGLLIDRKHSTNKKLLQDAHRLETARFYKMFAEQLKVRKMADGSARVAKMETMLKHKDKAFQAAMDHLRT